MSNEFCELQVALNLYDVTLDERTHKKGLSGSVQLIILFSFFWQSDKLIVFFVVFWTDYVSIDDILMPQGCLRRSILTYRW